MEKHGKKILIFSREFPPFVGGAGSAAFEYAKLLSNEANIHVTVLTEYIEGIEGKCSFKFDIKRMPSSKFLPGVLRFIKFKEFINYDLIILNDSSSIFFAGLFFSKKLLSKCICFFHGSEPERIYMSPNVFRRVIGYEKFYSRAINHCIKRVAVSKYMRKKMLTVDKLSGLVIDVDYTPIGNVDSVNEVDVDTKFIFNKIKNKRIYITASRLVRGKGHERVLNSLIELKKLGCLNWHWLVVGDGEYLNEFRTLVEESEVSRFVTFLGKVDRSCLNAIYSKSSCMILLSEFKESFGLVYLEANLAGIPSIGFNRYGAKEAIVNGQTGFLVNNENELVRILLEERYVYLSKHDMYGYAKSFDGSQFINKVRELIY
ncbi:hypothetical protein BIY21_14075 [Vibrio ponticus]|uniref:Glycosyltransferase family 1 protein n=1 Tax=Vibrio ponticus TaxID=265668 RepID=A0ABX3FEH3_9VIBR|nr:glycosyltransferase family 4 protein [Vibrio ponticus]OLQ89954.1 hypothetical protein BIY21_14075 [Vibrio ponticus]